MKNIIIIGARAFGRSVCRQIMNHLCVEDDFFVKGFLDDDSSILNGYDNYPPILSNVENYEVQTNDYFICALGNPIFRKKYVEIIISKGGTFTTCISKTATVLDKSNIGEGVIIGPYCFVDIDVVIEDYCSLLSYCSVTHDCHIGKYCEIEPYAAVAGGVILSNCVTLHTRSFIAPKIHIGENSIIGAGSVVLRNVESNCIMFGNPARRFPNISDL